MKVKDLLEYLQDEVKHDPDLLESDVVLYGSGHSYYKTYSAKIENALYEDRNISEYCEDDPIGSGEVKDVLVIE